jgi:hypothetical protein
VKMVLVIATIQPAFPDRGSPDVSALADEQVARLQRETFFVGVPGMDVAARGNIVVILCDLVASDDPAVFLDFLPGEERFANADDALPWDVVLRVPFNELAAGVEQEHLSGAILRFGAVQDNDDARGGGVVEQVFRQVDHALDEILLDEPFADLFFLVGIGVTRPRRRVRWA